MEILFTLTFPGFKVDPEQATRYRALGEAARWRTEVLEKAWEIKGKCEQGLGIGNEHQGPVRCVIQHLNELGIECPEYNRWQGQDQGQAWHAMLPLEDKDAREQVGHILRETIRRHETRKNRRGRGEMEGLQGEMNFQKNREAHRELGAYDSGVLTQIQTGAVITGDRQYRHQQQQGANACQHCDSGEPETVSHRWWRCARWECLRPQWFQNMKQLSETWPACAKILGIFPDNVNTDGRRPEEIQKVYVRIQKEVYKAEDTIQEEGDDDDQGGDDNDGNNDQQEEGIETNGSETETNNESGHEQESEDNGGTQVHSHPPSQVFTADRKYQCGRCSAYVTLDRRDEEIKM